MIKLKSAAYTLEAIIGAGIHPDIARTLLADGPKAVPERAIVSGGGRKRTNEPTTLYVWGPDAMTLLEGGGYATQR